MILASTNLKKYLRILGITAREFSKDIDFDETKMSLILNRKEEPSKDFIEKVLKETGMKFENAFDVVDEKSK